MKVSFLNLVFYISNCYFACALKAVTHELASKNLTSDLKKKPEVTCGNQKVRIQGVILGGTEALLGEFPWMARLYHKNNNGVKTFDCSGFLIAPKFVLTAAHCLESESHPLSAVFEVHLGEHNTKTSIDCNRKNTTCADKIQIIRVKKIISHPSYNRSSILYHHDIGLIYLKKGAKTSEYVSPICFLKKQVSNPSGYWLSGWGATREGGTGSSIKRKVRIPATLHSNCTKQYKIIGIRISNKQLCAGGKINKDSCQGDSGGPLMAVEGNHWFAAGIISYGFGCGREEWPGVYTNVTSYYDWISNTMSQVSSRDKKKSSKKRKQSLN